MSTEMTPPPARPMRTNVSARFGTLVTSRKSGMFGVAEIIAVAGSCFILLLVLLSYLYFMIPVRSRRTALIAERAQLQTNLKKSEEILSGKKNTQDTVQRITDSLTEFETVSLQRQDQGRMELYDQLNQLIVKNGLRNTSGPTYTPLDPTGSKATPGKSTSTKWQTAYPGIAVAVTVEGPYQNIRHFIKDIERSRQFVIINEVELQRATQSDGGAAVSAESGSGTKGSLVSLQLSMATYFQRLETGTPTSQEQ